VIRWVAKKLGLGVGDGSGNKAKENYYKFEFK